MIIILRHICFHLQSEKFPGNPMSWMFISFLGLWVTSIPQIQAWIAQLVVHQLGTMEVGGSNPDKGEDFSLKILNEEQQ